MDELDEKQYHVILSRLLQETKEPEIIDNIQRKIELIQSSNFSLVDNSNTHMRTIIRKMLFLDIECIQYSSPIPVREILDIVNNSAKVQSSLYQIDYKVDERLLTNKDKTMMTIAKTAHAIDKAKLKLAAELRATRQQLIACSGVIAGGSILGALLGSDIKDIDIYFDNIWKYMIFCRVAGRKIQSGASSRGYRDSFFMKNNIYYRTEISSVSSLDVILCKNVRDVIANFDLSFCKLAYDGFDITPINSSVQDALDLKGELSEEYLQYFLDGNQYTISRIIKYMKKGFQIKIPKFSQQLTMRIDDSFKEKMGASYFRINLMKNIPIYLYPIIEDFDIVYKRDIPLFFDTEFQYKFMQADEEFFTMFKAFIVMSKFSVEQKLLFLLQITQERSVWNYINQDARYGRKIASIKPFDSNRVKIEDLYFLFTDCKYSREEEKIDGPEMTRIANQPIVDFITLEEATIHEFLRVKHNFVVEIDGKYYGSSLDTIRQILNKFDYTVECFQPMHGVPRPKDVKFGSVFVSPHFDGITYIDASCLCLMALAVRSETCRIFSLGERRKVDYTTTLDNIIRYEADTSNWKNQPVNVVSGRHCNQGSDIQYFSSVRFITIHGVPPSCTIV